MRVMGLVPFRVNLADPSAPLSLEMSPGNSFRLSNAPPPDPVYCKGVLSVDGGLGANQFGRGILRGLLGEL